MVHLNYYNRAQQARIAAERASQPPPRGLRRMDEFSDEELAALEVKLHAWLQQPRESREVYQLHHGETGSPWE